MPKLFSVLKLKISDKITESNLKKLESKYLKNKKIKDLVSYFNDKNANSKSESSTVASGYKCLKDLCKNLAPELYGAIEVRQYEHDDKNYTVNNLYTIADCLKWIEYTKLTSSDKGIYISCKDLTKNAVKESLNIINDATKGFIAKSKVNDILFLTFYALYFCIFKGCPEGFKKIGKANTYFGIMQ